MVHGSYSVDIVDSPDVESCDDDDDDDDGDADEDN